MWPAYDLADQIKPGMTEPEILKTNLHFLWKMHYIKTFCDMCRSVGAKMKYHC